MLTVYTTMPEWDGAAPAADYRRNIVEQARWSEEAGCRGALIFSDNEQLEAWTAAQMIVASTERFVPLIAGLLLMIVPYFLDLTWMNVCCIGLMASPFIYGYFES